MLSFFVVTFIVLGTAVTYTKQMIEIWINFEGQSFILALMSYPSKELSSAVRK